VYLVHHGFRESIELFEIDVKPASPAFTWIGCVVAPEGTNLNSVAPLPHGGFVATNPYNRDIPDARNRAGKGEPAGEVREWEPGKGWTIVPGSESAGPNGIEVSSDGAWLYINLWPARKMMRLSRGQTPVKKDVVDVPFHPDNMRWQSNGTLLSAGHDAPTMARATECLRVTCNDAAARVARWDPKTLRVEEAVRYPSDDVFFGATAALQVGKEIWIGSVRGDRIARYPAR
jgi:sugar lactone lactonase YvrE